MKVGEDDRDRWRTARSSLALIGWYFERLLSYNPTDGTTPQALGANSHRLYGPVFCRNFYALKIGLELAPCDTCDLGTDPAQVLCLSTRLHRIAHLRSLFTDFTHASHT